MGIEAFLAPVLANTWLVRINGQAQIRPISVAAKNPLFVTEIVIDARVQLVIVASHTRIGGKVVDVREGLTRQIGRSPIAGQDFRGGIQPVWRNDVPRELLPGDNFVPLSIPCAGRIAQTTAGG